MSKNIAVIGAGIGGLVAAAVLAHRGFGVTVFEAGPVPGGKMRTVPSEAGPVDAGPTVLTMKPVFQRIFAEMDEALEDHLTLTPLDCLARHFWDDGTRLDLFADKYASANEIDFVFGTKAAKEYLAFAARAERLFDAFDAPMMQAEEPSLMALTARVMLRPRLIADMAPGRTLAGLLDGAFSEPKLAQLFGRYATYVGGSPHQAPGILALISDAEARGVWSAAGGMASVATALESLAKSRGAVFHYDSPVREIVEERAWARAARTDYGRHRADRILFNGDPRALAMGRLGRAAQTAVTRPGIRPRSLSAHVAAFAAEVAGPELAYHTVFFGHDPRAEFAALEAGRVPKDATLYVCAQDRAFGPATGPERFEIIRNAPPLDPGRPEEEHPPCPSTITQALARFGLHFDRPITREDLTGPAEFEDRFPDSLGSLYGLSPKGIMAALKRPQARSRMPGLYLCGGGTHPGAGVPMAALSGLHAAEAIWQDLASTSPYRQTATPGGTSTASPRTAAEPSRS